MQTNGRSALYLQQLQKECQNHLDIPYYKSKVEAGKPKVEVNPLQFSTFEVTLDFFPFSKKKKKRQASEIQ